MVYIVFAILSLLALDLFSLLFDGDTRNMITFIIGRKIKRSIRNPWAQP